MSAIAPFRYQDQELRFVGTAEQPEWVGADVVNILYPLAIENKNQSTYLAKVPDEWKGSKPVATLGGRQEMTTLYEPGLYHLICRSDSPLAVPFQQWVFEEVLPSIRKTGGYTTSASYGDRVIARAKVLQAELGMAANAQLVTMAMKLVDAETSDAPPHKAKTPKPGYGGASNRVLEALNLNEPLTSQEVAALAKISGSTARRALVILLRQGSVRRTSIADTERRCWRYAYCKTALNKARPKEGGS